MSLYQSYYTLWVVGLAFGCWLVCRLLFAKKLRESSSELKQQIVWIQRGLIASQKHFNVLKDSGADDPTILEDIKVEIEKYIKDLEVLRRAWKSNKWKRRLLLLK